MGYHHSLPLVALHLHTGSNVPVIICMIYARRIFVRCICARASERSLLSRAAVVPCCARALLAAMLADAAWLGLPNAKTLVLFSSSTLSSA